MSPLLQRILESKEAHRKRLRALSYPEKVRIVKQMRDAMLMIQIKARWIQPSETPPHTKSSTDQTTF